LSPNSARKKTNAEVRNAPVFQFLPISSGFLVKKPVAPV
jgi:hypothetical protein